MSWFKRKVIENIAAQKVKQELGSKTLSQVAVVVRASIPVVGVERTRTNLIKSIDNDLRRAARKGGQSAVDKLVNDALNTPQYVALLKDLGLNEDHIKLMAQEAINGSSK